jgi:hypothetical protein
MKLSGMELSGMELSGMELRSMKSKERGFTMPLFTKTHTNRAVSSGIHHSRSIVFRLGSLSLLSEERVQR